MARQDSNEPLGMGYDPDHDGVGASVRSVGDVPRPLRARETEHSCWIHGTDGRHMVALAQPVVSLDGERVGLVQEITDTALRVDREDRPDLFVPCDGVLDVTGDRVLLKLPLAEIDRSGWERRA